MWNGIASIIRNALLALGSGIVANGLVSNTELDTLVGAALVLVSVIWKLIVRAQAKKTE